MSESVYDEPRNQWTGSAITPEAERWDQMWSEYDDQKWDLALPDHPQFMESMRQVSALLAEDKRFWNLSAKHVFRNLKKDLNYYVLQPLHETGTAYPKEWWRYTEEMDWAWMARLLLNSILKLVADAHRQGGSTDTNEYLSRFDELKAMAERANDVVTFALFVERSDQLFWDDAVLEQVNVKSFVDELTTMLEDPDRAASDSAVEPNWEWIEWTVSSMVQKGHALAHFLRKTEAAKKA